MRPRFHPGRVFLYAFALIVIAFLLLPSLLLVPVSLGAAEHLQFPPQSLSLRWYAAYLSDPEWVGPTLFSLRIAGLTMLVASVAGTMAALALIRGQLGRVAAVNAFITAPLILPGIVYAIAVLFLFAALRLSGTTLGFVLAHTVLASPYVVLIVSAALSRVNPDLELAAQSLGASRVGAVLRITLPLILPGVLSSAAFAFHASFDDATVSFFISGVTDKSLPRKMFENVEFSVTPVLAVVSTLFTVFTLVLIGVVQVWAAARIRRTISGAEQDGPDSAREDLRRWRALDRVPER